MAHIGDKVVITKTVNTDGSNGVVGDVGFIHSIERGNIYVYVVNINGVDMAFYRDEFSIMESV